MLPGDHREETDGEPAGMPAVMAGTAAPCTAVTHRGAPRRTAGLSDVAPADYFTDTVKHSVRSTTEESEVLTSNRTSNAVSSPICGRSNLTCVLPAPP